MLVGCENRLNGVLDATAFQGNGIRFLLPERTGLAHWYSGKGSGTLIVRPEALQLVQHGAKRQTDVSAQVIRTSIRQGYYQLQMMVGEQVFVMRLPFGSDLPPQADELCWIRIDWAQVSWIPEAEMVEVATAEVEGA